MLRSDVIDLVNSGDLWMFVGSGVAIDSGLPSWGELTVRIVERLDDDKASVFGSDKVAQRSLSQADWPLVFQRLEQIAGRAWLEENLAIQLKEPGSIGPILSNVARWPVRGFVTSNYDGLIESALLACQRRGWVSVGNAGLESQKVTRDADQVVWHVHGMLGLESSRSKLILTSSDYDETYADSGAIDRQLGGLLRQRRILILGFGFEDPDLMRLLAVVGRATDPSRPAVAFIGAEPDVDTEAEAEVLMAKYNVDPVFYRKQGSDHSQLPRLLELYGHFIARNFVSYGQKAFVVPQVAIEPTGLHIYNELALREDFTIERDLFQTLLESWVLAQLSDCDQSSRDLVVRLAAAERLLGRARDAEDPSSQVNHTLETLADRGLIRSDSRGMATLSEDGKKFVDQAAASSELLHDRFIAALRDRCANGASDDAAERVTLAAAEYFIESLEKRALAVSLTLESDTTAARDLNAVQMLQTLPAFMERLDGFDEAVLLSNVVRGVLSDPTDVERSFLGSILQAQFGVHLLGLDEDALRERVKQFRKAAFVVDSNIVIPYLAKGSRAHELAQNLASSFGALGSRPLTTPLLVDEVVEHANWALSNTSGDLPGLRDLLQITGRTGYSSNAFVSGFTALRADANGPPTFVRYMESLGCLVPGQSRVRAADVVKLLQAGGIEVVDVTAVLSADAATAEAVDELAEGIAAVRQERGTYRHDRQVRAEAIVVFLVQRFREGTASEFGDFEDVDDAYFISTSGAIDDPRNPGRPITMSTAAASHWLTTLCPQMTEIGHRALVDGLLAELEQSGAEFVNRRQLKVAFSGLIEESGRQLSLATERHRELTAAVYGSDSSSAYSEIDPVDIPVAVNALVTQVQDRLEQKAMSVKKAQTEAELTERERSEYEKLKAEKQHRRARYEKRKARLESRPKKKRRRR